MLSNKLIPLTPEHIAAADAFFDNWEKREVGVRKTYPRTPRGNSRKEIMYGQAELNKRASDGDVVVC